ncbi:MAG: permease prefix domain 1-containing protein [Acutalibacteraceae bacterium]
MENKFLNRVSELIEDKIARKQIKAELESHLLDKIDYYTEIGYTHEEAEKKATEEMGDPDDTAVPMNSLHNRAELNYILIFLSFIAIAALLFLGNTHSDSFGYANNRLENCHYIKYDFLSFLIFAGNAFLLWLSHKRRIKAISAMMLCSFVIQIWFTLTSNYLFQQSGIFSSDVTTLFQPLAYAAVTIVTKGFSGYIDSVFSYGYNLLPTVGAAIYKGIAISLFVFLVVWTAAVYFEISRQEKMKTTRRFKTPLKLVPKITGILLSLNLIIMSTGTVIAYQNLDSKIDGSRESYKKMIDCVLNADQKADISKQYEFFSSEGYEETPNIQLDLQDKSIYFVDGSNMLEMFDGSGSYYSIFARMAAPSYTLVGQPLLCNSLDYSELATYDYGTSLSDFLKSELYTRSYEVERDFFATEDGGDRIYFNFRFDESADYDVRSLRFENGVLVENTLLPYIPTIKSERQEIIEHIVSDSFLNDYYGKGDDALNMRLAELENQGFKMEDKSTDESVKRYENDDDYNRLILESNSNTGIFYFKFYSTTACEPDISANDGLYFQEDDFDSFEIGMTLENFSSLPNNHYWSDAACVTSRLDYDAEKGQYTDRTVRFIYAIHSESEDVSGVVYKYVLEFKNGILTAKYKDGLFSEVYNDWYY